MSAEIVKIKSEPLSEEESSEDAPEKTDVICLEVEVEDDAINADKGLDDLEKQLASHLTIAENDVTSVSSDDTICIHNTSAVIQATSPLTASTDTGIVSFSSSTPASTSTTSVDTFALEDKVQQVERENESLRKSLESVQTDLATVRALLARTKTQLAQMTAQYLAEKKMTEVISKVQCNSSGTEQTNMQENDSLSKEVKRLEMDVKMNVKNLMMLEKDLNCSRESVRLLTNKLLIAETALEEAKQAKEALEHQHVNTNKICMDLKQQINMLKANEQHYLQKLHSVEENTEHTNLMALELSALKSHHDAIKGKLMNAEIKVKDLENQLFIHKKNDFPANLMKRKLQDAQDKQKTTDSAMTVLVQKLATLENIKEDAEITMANLKIAQNDRKLASDKIKRLKRRLNRKNTAHDTLLDKCSSLITFFHNLEERSAKGDLTHSDFDTALNFIISSDLSNLSKEKKLGQIQQLNSDNDSNDDDDEITVLSPSPTKDIMDKVVNKLKAVEITSKRLSEVAKPPSGIARRGVKDRIGKKKLSGSRSTHSRHIRRSRRARSRSYSRSHTNSIRSSDNGHTRRRNSVSPRPSYEREISCHSTSRSIESVSRSRSASTDYGYSRSSRKSYRGTCRSRNCSADYCPSKSRQSRSVSREPPSKRRTHIKKEKIYSEKSKGHDKKSSKAISKETSSAKRLHSTDRSNEPESTAIQLVERLQIKTPEVPNCTSPIDNNKPVQDVYETCLLELDIDTISGNKGECSPDIQVLGVKKPSETSANVLPLEEGELVDFLATSDDTLQLLSTNRDADEDGSLDSSQDSQSVAGTSNSNRIGSFTPKPEIETLCVIRDDDDDDVEESMLPVSSPRCAPLLPIPSLTTRPLQPPPSPPPMLAVEIKNVPACYFGSNGNYKPIQMDRDSRSMRTGAYAQQIPGHRNSYTPPSGEDWDAESAIFLNQNNNGVPRNWTFNGTNRGSYNTTSNFRVTMPSSRPYRRPYRGRNRRHVPYSREDKQRCPTIPLQVNLGASSSQAIAGQDLLDEYMQLYTISIRREIPGFAGKGYVEILKEQCETNGWGDPIFTYHAETTRSPGNNKLEYFCKIFFNGTYYQPKHGSTVKKDAQSIAALYCLQELGVLGERS